MVHRGTAQLRLQRGAGEPAGPQFVSADAIRTRYRQWGSGGPPVVLVHGFAESADTWNRVAGLLAAHRRVYALDMTGWGYSRRRGPYEAERLWWSTRPRFRPVRI